MKIVAKHEVSEVLRRLDDKPMLSLDTETTGLRPHHGDILFSIIIADESEEYYFNFNGWNTDSDSEHVLSGTLHYEEFQELFSDAGRIWALHNAKFDMAFLRREGLELHGTIHDTWHIARLLDNDEQSYSLKNCVLRAGLGAKSDAVEEYIEKNKLWEWKTIPGKKTREKNKFFHKVPLDVVAPYACMDARLTFNLAVYQLRRIGEMTTKMPEGMPTIAPLVVNERALTRVCFEMEHRGVKVDRDYCLETLSREETRISRATSTLTEMSGKPFTNHPLAIAAAFPSLPSLPTAKGNASYDSSVLEGVDDPAAKLILEYRDAKSRADFLNGFLYHMTSDHILRASFNQAGTVTGRFSCYEPNCLSMDTEILTEDGWKDSVTLTKNDSVYCFNIETKLLEIHKPTEIYRSEPKPIEWVHVKNMHLDMLLTSNHRVLVQNRKTKDFEVHSAGQIPSDALVWNAAIMPKGSRSENPPSLEFLQFLVAAQADGSFIGKQIVFSFSKMRKVARLEGVLKSLGLSYKRTDYTALSRPHVRIFVRGVSPNWFKGFLSSDKKFTYKILSLSMPERTFFLAELRYWDGLSTRETLDVCSKHRANIDVIQAVCAISGRRAHTSLYLNKYHILRSPHRHACGLANASVRKFRVDEDQCWCVTVPTGFILCRRGADTFITGNCQNLTKDDPDDPRPEEFPIRRAIVPRPGFCLVMLDYDQVEYRMLLNYAKARGLIEKIKGGLDVHEATAQIAGITRKDAKAANFAKLFGAGLPKLAKTIKKGLGEAKAIVDSIDRAAPEISELTRRIIQVAEKRGWIVNWFGRILRYPDKGSCYRAVNHLIQGGCADVTKRAMVECAARLVGMRSGLVLTIHDELVFEIHRSELSVVPDLKKIMESVYEAPYLPLTVGVEHSWVSLADKVEGVPT